MDIEEWMEDLGLPKSQEVNGRALQTCWFGILDFESERRPTPKCCRASCIQRSNYDYYIYLQN